VGLEFLRSASQVDPAKLAPHLSRLEYLEFVKLPQSTAKVAAKWRERLPERYAVMHCETEK
jgi:hypothetical protein